MQAASDDDEAPDADFLQPVDGVCDEGYLDDAYPVRNLADAHSHVTQDRLGWPGAGDKVIDIPNMQFPPLPQPMPENVGTIEHWKEIRLEYEEGFHDPKLLDDGTHHVASRLLAR